MQSPQKRRNRLLTQLILLIWFLTSLAIFFSGSYSTLEALRSLFKPEIGNWNPIMDERIPRWIILSLSGSSLAVAGAAMQALFANPLASPSSLGITSGGSLLIALAYCLGLVPSLPISLPLLAFIGSLVTLLAVYSLSKYSRGGSNGLLLVGLAVSTLLTALENSLIYSVRDNWNLVRVLSEWSSASSIDRSWSDVGLQLPFCLVGSLMIWQLRQEIDLVSLGEEQAQALGVCVQSLRWKIFLAVSLITGSTLATLGSLPFFGLLLPHLVRLCSGPRHQELLPLCMLSGAAILCLLDWGLRFSSFHYLSLNNICAIAGAIGFMFLFLRSQRRAA